MLGFKFIYLLYLTVLSDTNAYHFLQQGDYNKCCKPNEILISVKSKGLAAFKCVIDETKTFNIQTASFLPSFPQATCIDVLQRTNIEDTFKVVVKVENVGTWKATALNTTHFPKCCPIGFAYNSLEHKCVASTTGRIVKEFSNLQEPKGFLVLKPGLGGCNSVIADFELPSLQEITPNEDNGLFLSTLNKTFAFGDYCFDDVYNSDHYVVRVCYPNFGICRRRTNDTSKIRCVRKCCPDGESYLHTQCTDDLYHGLSFVNASRAKNPKEPFAIIAPTYCNKYMSDIDRDQDFLGDRGYVRFILEENPPVYYSPFKESHCYENVDYGKEHKQQLFVCLRNTFGIHTDD